MDPPGLFGLTEEHPACEPLASLSPGGNPLDIPVTACDLVDPSRATGASSKHLLQGFLALRGGQLLCNTKKGVLRLSW